MGLYCRVIVDIAHENVARPFTYLIPEGMNLSPGQRVAVPFGAREKEGVVLSLTDAADFDPAKIRTVIRPLEDYPAILPAMIELAEEMADKAHCPLAETLRLMLPAEMRGGRVRVRTVELAALAVPRAEAEEALEKERRSPKRREILRLLIAASPLRVTEIAEEVRDPREALKALRDAGLIRLTEEESLRTPGEGLPLDNEQWHPLTEMQQEALEEILPTLEKGGGRFLLHGVTGSGKTEVFLNAVRQTLRLGKSAIILVPEIALTPQMVRWFRARFGEVSAVLHSRLSAGERYDEWRRIRRGEARVIIGARSAVFAPAERLGLIVVDEEHESTYFSDHHPRYDAREVAESRCRREGASLILASATPSILSFARARRGDFMLLEMSRRVAGRPMPEVTVVDMRRELESGNRSVLSRELAAELGACLHGGQQAMLLINRRGYHSFVSCRSCGYVVKCPQCDVSMTCHIGEDGRQRETRLRCHYCGNSLPVPEKCPSCGSPYIRYFGAGTQKVEEEVQRLFPGTATVRMDIDTTGGRDGHARILEEFRSGRARVLIGTQMIAKGLAFPDPGGRPRGARKQAGARRDSDLPAGGSGDPPGRAPGLPGLLRGGVSAAADRAVSSLFGHGQGADREPAGDRGGPDGPGDRGGDPEGAGDASGLEEAGADDVPGAAGAEAAERASQEAGAVQTADGAGHGGVLRLPDGNRGQAAAGSPVLL